MGRRKETKRELHVFTEDVAYSYWFLSLFIGKRRDNPLISNCLVFVCKSYENATLFLSVNLTMIKYANETKNEEMMISLTSSIVTNIQDAVEKEGQTLEVILLCLSIILRLLHLLKQYSGDEWYHLENTRRQNSQCLKNFDSLIEYRLELTENAVWICVFVLNRLEQEIGMLIVPAILENKGIDAGGPPGAREDAGVSSTGKENPLEGLMRKLDVTYNLLSSYDLDVAVTNQVFGHLFHLVCARALNNLLLSKELCNWTKGLDIRYNVSSLEEWGKRKKMEEAVKVALNPLMQASQILMERKIDDEVDTQTICGIAGNLTILQVVTLLNLYLCQDSGDRVSKTFINRVKSKLFVMRLMRGQSLEQLHQERNSKLLMDTQLPCKVKIPFNPSPVKLEEINIPENFGIGQWVSKK